MRNLILLLLSAGLCRGAVTVDILVDFESGNNGDVITSSYLSNVTRTASGVSGFWTSDTTPTNFLVGTAAARAFPGGFKVGSTTYTGGTRGCNVLITDSEFWNNWLPSQVDIVSGGFFFLFNPPDQGTSPAGYDLLICVASVFDLGVAQWYNTNPPLMNSHQLPPPSGATVIRGTNYWLTWKWTRNTDFRFQVYDTSVTPWAFVTNESVNVLALTNNEPMKIFRFGCQPHGSDPGTLYFDTLVIDYTTAQYPILPTFTDNIPRPTGQFRGLRLSQ